MGKKCKCPPEELGIPGWVVTYGDMMSLLLTFFILLLSFSSIQESKFKDAMESLQGALGVLKNPPSMMQLEHQIVAQPRQTDNSEVYYQLKKLEQYLVEQELDSSIEVEMTADGVNIRITDDFMFDSGRADLKPVAADLITRIGGLLDGQGEEIVITGHTDSIPIHTARFPSNWELSAARAIAVARHFQGNGLDPARMRAVGFGEFRPLADNATVEGRALNRRVEILLKMKEKAVERPVGLPLVSEGK